MKKECSYYFPLLPNSVEYYDVVFGKPIKGRIRFSKHSIQFFADFSSHIT